MFWYLKHEENIFGPVSLELLQAWAMEGRIVSEDFVSKTSDGDWMAAPELKDLAMEWEAKISDKETYGPLNILAFGELLRDGNLDPSITISNKNTGESFPITFALCSALIDQNRQLSTALFSTPEDKTNEKGSKTRSVTDTSDKTIGELKAQLKVLQEDQEQLKLQAAKGETYHQQINTLRSKLKEVKQKQHKEELENQNYKGKIHNLQQALNALKIEKMKFEKNAKAEKEKKLSKIEEEPFNKDSWTNAIKQNERLQRDCANWKLLYEKELDIVNTLKKQLENSNHTLNKQHIENTDKISELTRRLQISEQSLEEALNQEKNAIPGSNENGINPIDLYRAYNELSHKFDVVMQRMRDKSAEFEEYMESHQEAGKKDRERIEYLEKTITEEQEKSRTIRNQNSQTERQYQDLLRAYREINNKFIQVKGGIPDLSPQKEKTPEVVSPSPPPSQPDSTSIANKPLPKKPKVKPKHIKKPSYKPRTTHQKKNVHSKNKKRLRLTG